MSVQTMGSMLEQIKLQTRQISGVPSLTSMREEQENQGVASFAAMLSNSLHGISTLQNTAQGQAQDYLTGKPGVGLNDVMVSLQKSSVALNLGVQVRNKMVSAYQEIMSMAV